MLKWFKILNKNNIKEKTIIYIHGIYILLIKKNNKYFAIEDNCPHQNMPINKGRIMNNILTCPFHNASFCIKTGKIKDTLSISDLNIFKIKIKKNKIKIQIKFSC